jgi:hypothetical protein
MTGISKDVEFDSRNAKIDAQLLREQLLKGKRAKAKVIKIVHGVPIYFKDEEASMTAEEMRLSRKNLKSQGGGVGEEGL